MSLLKIYQGLSSKQKLGVGVGLLAWGMVGHYLSDRIEEKNAPSETDKATLEKIIPKVQLVDREERS